MDFLGVGAVGVLRQNPVGWLTCSFFSQMAAENCQRLDSLFLAIQFLILVFSGSPAGRLGKHRTSPPVGRLHAREKRPRVRDRDRLLWIMLKKLWKDWRAALSFSMGR